MTQGISYWLVGVFENVVNDDENFEDEASKVAADNR